MGSKVSTPKNNPVQTNKKKPTIKISEKNENKRSSSKSEGEGEGELFINAKKYKDTENQQLRESNNSSYSATILSNKIKSQPVKSISGNNSKIDLNSSEEIKLQPKKKQTCFGKIIQTFKNNPWLCVVPIFGWIALLVISIVKCVKENSNLKESNQNNLISSDIRVSDNLFNNNETDPFKECIKEKNNRKKNTPDSNSLINSVKTI